MDIYIRRIIEKEKARVLKENDELKKEIDDLKKQRDDLKKRRDDLKKQRDDLKKQKTQRHLLISELIKILISHGISIADIAEETNIPYDLLQSFVLTT